MQRRLANVAQITDLAFVESNPRHFCEAALAMTDTTPPLSGLSPVSGKTFALLERRFSYGPHAALAACLRACNSLRASG
jgi:hypothetical protein